MGTVRVQQNHVFLKYLRNCARWSSKRTFDAFRRIFFTSKFDKCCNSCQNYYFCIMEKDFWRKQLYCKLMFGTSQSRFSRGFFKMTLKTSDLWRPLQLHYNLKKVFKGHFGKILQYCTKWRFEKFSLLEELWSFEAQWMNEW